MLGIEIVSHVVSIGSATIGEPLAITFHQVRAIPEDSPIHCVNTEAEQAMMRTIDAAREAGDTMGGSFEVLAHGVPPGLGSHVQWDRKLDGRLAQALMSIQAIKAVGIGRGPDVAVLPGSRIHDEILPGVMPPLGVSRPTNNAGGLEGGITNGEDLRVTAYMKPIATLMKPLRSIDVTTMEESPAAIERSDVCAVPAAAVVGEAMVAIVLPRPHSKNLAAIRSTNWWTTGAPARHAQLPVFNPRSRSAVPGKGTGIVRGRASRSTHDAAPHFEVRRLDPSRQGRSRRRDHPQHQPADRRYGGNHVRGAGHWPRGAADCVPCVFSWSISRSDAMRTRSSPS